MDISVKTILFAALTVLMVSNYGFITQGIMRKIAARVGRRIGVPFYQLYIDLIKVFAKRSGISHGIMFDLGPVFRLTGGIGLLLFIPVVYGSPYFANFSFAGDLILVLYFLFFGMLGMALGAGEGGHPYSAMAIARGLSLATVTEVPLTMAIISVAAQYQTLSITEIVAAQQGGFMNWTVFTNPLAVAAGMLALLGSFGRSPFDIVMAPTEIPIGPPTEYQSSFLGLLQLNRSILPVAKLVLFANLFFGGAVNLQGMGSKVFIMSFYLTFVSVVFPRYRPEQAFRWFLIVPALLGGLSLILNLV